MTAQPEKLSHARRGDAARDRRDWQAAAEQYRLHLKARHDDFGIWVQLGHALKESGRLAEALVAYNRALTLNDRDPDVLISLGHLHKVMKLYEVAKTYYRRSAELDGNAIVWEEFRLLGGETTASQAPAANKPLMAISDTVAPPVGSQENEPQDTNDRDLAEKDYELIRESGLFDEAWYLDASPELRDAQDTTEGVRHYVTHGAARGLNPHPLFDTNYYLRENADVVASGLNPLVHYIKYGASEGRNPHPLFDVVFYLTRNPDVEKSGIGALQHFIRYGGPESSDPTMVGRSPHILFDTSYYFQENADVIASGLNPLVHYIKYGAREGRNPHPLFDNAFYLERNPDVANSGIPALQHFLENGGKEGRDPNPYFNTKWYLESNPNVAVSEINPLVHYIMVGEASGSNPSPDFDIDWYLRCNLDVVRAGISPLYHFLRSGFREGREPNRTYGLLGKVTDAEIICVKEPSLNKEVALFVAHSPDGYLKAHVRHYLDSLNQHGISTVLIVAADMPFSDIDPDIIAQMNGLFIRENVGFDFGAWAHVLRLYPDLMTADILYLINDSVFGPINDQLFGQALKKLRDSSSDVLGLTDSFEFRWHIQSYFLAFKKSALVHDALRQFFQNVVSFARKISVTAEYEVPLAGELLLAGLSCEVIFPQNGSTPTNRTLFQWRSLIESGFPFVKVATIRDEHPEVDKAGWQEVLASRGYDVSIAERTLSGARPSLETNDPAPATATSQLLAWAPEPSVYHDEFDPKFYLAIYPDVAAAGIDPYEHYINHGRREGRHARAPAELDVLDNHPSMARADETVLVVSHEGVRGGAPILAYNLVKGFLRKYNVITLFLSDGPILENCRDAGAVVVGPIGLAGSTELSDFVVNRIVNTAPIKFAIVNTIAARHVLPALSRRYVPTVSLIHEFAAYIRPRSAFRDAVYWSGQVVFSTPITRDNAIAEYPELSAAHYTIMPQGRCTLPEELGSQDSDILDNTPVRHLVRPESFPAEGLVVLGAGLVDYRKGVDLFIDCAARVLALAPDLPFRFVWIGRGFNPDGDVGYSVYLDDQIRRYGISQHICFVPEVAHLDPIYATADILLLSSRLDPLPNVAIDALTVGLPVICFANTTGIADILVQSGLGEETVAPYLDIDSLAQKVIALAKSKDLRTDVATKCRRISRSIFDMNVYVASVEEVAAQQAVRAKQEQLDVETVNSSDLPQLDFYLLPGQQGRPRNEVIREYVRSWASGIGRRKLFPGFHPGIYREQHGLTNPLADPLADYIRAGQPTGPWIVPLIRQNDPVSPIPASVRIGLHIHAYHLEVFPEILERLTQNRVRPDLLISVKSRAARDKVQEMVSAYSGGQVHIHLVPDPGRDVGPFLSEFGQIMLKNYDLIGHLHTKVSNDVADNSVGKIWAHFMLENVLGRESVPMADIILSRMVKEPDIGLVFADDPHVVGWDKNKEFVVPFLEAFSLETYPENLHFPVGAMFWARPQALKLMFDLGLTWSDYPPEPLPYDGSLLHGLERLYGLATRQAGMSIVNTNINGITR